MFCNTSEAQNFSSIVDSCHYYLDKQDTMSFNKTYIRILDAYEKEYDADEVGVLKMELVPRNELRTGDVGYIISGIKTSKEVKVYVCC